MKRIQKKIVYDTEDLTDEDIAIFFTLFRIKPEMAMKQFKPEDVLKQFKPEDVVKQFKPEDVVKQFKPEDLLKGLDPEIVEAYLKKAKKQ